MGVVFFLQRNGRQLGAVGECEMREELVLNGKAVSVEEGGGIWKAGEVMCGEGVAVFAGSHL